MSTPILPQVSRVVPANEYRRMRWCNGQGWTREIACGPDREAWDWRLSIAEVEGDCAFSSFPGIERELVLIRGNGMRLCFGDGERVELHPPHGRLRFSGVREVSAELLDGPTHDFNLMWRPGALHAELLLRPLVGPMFFFAGPGTHWALHLLAGQARFDAASQLPPLWAGDTAILAGGAGRRRYALEGGGELLAVKLSTL
ncbi:MAG: HutD family protein [Pseudoxanthomonas sp.]